MNATLQEMRKATSALMAKVENMAVFQNSSELGLGQEALAFAGLSMSNNANSSTINNSISIEEPSKIAQLRSKFSEIGTTPKKKM